MNAPELCPACLTELPDGYAYDHVAIDLALAGRRDLFAAMNEGERREVVLTGLGRRLNLSVIADRLGWPYGRVQELLPDEHPQSAAGRYEAIDQRVKELYEQDLKDMQIALRIGAHVSVVGKVRKRLRLPAKFGPGGKRLAEVRTA